MRPENVASGVTARKFADHMDRAMRLADLILIAPIQDIGARTTDRSL